MNPLFPHYYGQTAAHSTLRSGKKEKSDGEVAGEVTHKEIIPNRHEMRCQGGNTRITYKITTKVIPVMSRVGY